MWDVLEVRGKIQENYWKYSIGLLGLLIVIGYLAFEYLVYGEFLEDVIGRPLEHFIIFSILPLSIALGYAVDRNIEAERALYEKNRHAETVINAIGEGVVELDPDFKILTANDFVVNLVKRTRDGVLGMRCYELFHNRGVVCLDCPVKVTFETGESACASHEGIAKDGTPIYVELNSYPVKDFSGRIVRVIETVRDISEKRKYDAEMAEKRVLEKINKAAVHRELKMVELKKRINELEKKVGDRDS